VFEMPDYTLKLARASELIEELEGQMHDYCGRALGVDRDTKTVPGHTIFRAVVREEVPVMWNTDLGDILHNLRSALDIAACDLVRRNGGVVTPETGFPLCTDRERFENLLAVRLRGIAPVVDLVRELQPYEGGNDEDGQILPLLERLDAELNRHGGRPIAIAICFTPRGDRGHYLQDDLSFFAGQMRLRELSQWPGRWFVVVDGMELYRVSEADPERYREPGFTLELTLAKVDMGSTTNLPEFFGWLERSVQRVCERMLSFASPAI
jgi:hypothetical protein